MEDIGQKILSEYDVVSGFAGQDLEAPVNLLEILDPLPLPIPVFTSPGLDQAAATSSH